MSRMWKVALFLLVSILLLSACGQTIEDQTEAGLKRAEEIFHKRPKAPNTEVDGTNLYKPLKLKVSDASDAHNIVLNKGKQPFILFINPNEAPDSRLFYDLLHADEVDIVDEEKFSDGNIFGFVAVIQHEEDQVELIVNVGGAKMTTLTVPNSITSDLETMMRIVRSIE